VNIIRNALGYVVFAVIVLFQADIRRALAHFGRAPFLRYFSRVAGAEDTVEELVTAVGNLSAHKIGAIIIIERQIGLRNYIEGGIPLDATITYDLLASIFQPSAPLHDGAVIVQGDRIAAAACFLPLSVNPKVSRQLGTRHRAALGLTEENDAVAVVVSEETGIISVAINGRIERDFTQETLRCGSGPCSASAATDTRPLRRRGARPPDAVASRAPVRADAGVPGAGHGSVAAGGRRADRRAHHAHPARVHEPAGPSRAGRRCARDRGRRVAARRPV
jgi:diadenylate cyclase